MTDVSKASAISLIQTIMVQPVNALGKWATDNDPTGTAITEAIPHPLNVDLMAGQVITTYPNLDPITTVTYVLGHLTTVVTPPAISSTSLNRIELIEVMRQTAVLLSRVRNVRLIKTNYPYDTASNFYDNTAPANMASTFGLPLSSFPYPVAGVMDGTVETNDVSVYFSALHTVLENWRNTTLTYTEKYCHSNCHSNCHGNRGRR